MRSNGSQCDRLQRRTPRSNTDSHLSCESHACDATQHRPKNLRPESNYQIEALWQLVAAVLWSGSDKLQTGESLQTQQAGRLSLRTAAAQDPGCHTPPPGKTQDIRPTEYVNKLVVSCPVLLSFGKHVCKA